MCFSESGFINFCQAQIAFNKIAIAEYKAR